MQILTANYLSAGYYFYSLGRIPEGKDPAAVDAKLVEKYGIDVSRSTRWRRKKAGYGNVHLIRFEHSFLLLCTHGRHEFFEKEDWRDCRRNPIKFGGYSITCKRGDFRSGHGANGKPIRDDRMRVRVQVARPVFADWRAYFMELARFASAKRVAGELYCWPYIPFAPVRRQWLDLLRVVNKVRRERGRSKIESGLATRFWRDVVRPFDDEVTLEELQTKWRCDFVEKWERRFKKAA